MAKSLKIAKNRKSQKLCPGCGNLMRRNKVENGSHVWECNFCGYEALANAIMRKEDSEAVKRYLRFVEEQGQT